MELRKEATAIRIRKQQRLKATTEWRNAQKAAFKDIFVLDNYTQLSYSDQQHGLQFLGADHLPVRWVELQLAKLQTMSYLIRSDFGQMTEAQTSLMLQGFLEGISKHYMANQIKELYDRRHLLDFFINSIDSEYEGVMLKSISFLGLLANYPGFQADFQDLVWRYYLFDKILDKMEKTDRLRIVSRCGQLMGCLIEQFPHQVNKVLNSDSILQKLEDLVALSEDLNPHESLVFLLSRLLMNYGEFNVKVDRERQFRYFKLHMSLFDKLDNMNKGIGEEWFTGVCNYSEHAVVESILIEYSVDTMAINGLSNSYEIGYTNLFWEKSEQVFKEVYDKRREQFIKGIYYVFVETKCTVADFRLFLQLIEMFLLTLVRHRKQNMIESGFEFPDNYPEIIPKEDLDQFRNGFLLVRLASLSLQHNENSIKIKSAQLLIYIYQRIPPMKGRDSYFIPAAMDIPINNLSCRNQKMYLPSLELVVELLTFSDGHKQKLNAMIEGISDELHELSNDYNPNEAQLADKIIEITGI